VPQARFDLTVTDSQPGVEDYKKNMFALLGKPGYEDMKANLEARLAEVL
jgi:glucose-6-phosphate isomerase